MTCDVLFIYPPTNFGKRVRFGFPPLGILYLASFLKKNGVKVKLVDAEIKGYSLSNILDVVRREEPFLVCISIMTNHAVSCLKIAEAIKRQNGPKIVVGGPHIGSTREEILSFTDAIDFLVYGEGEHTLYQLYTTLRSKGELSKVSGLIYKDKGKVVVNPIREYIMNLDELPFPNLRLLDVKDYDSYYAKSLPLTSMMSSRGCPYSCSFCDQYATHGKRLRLRSPKNIVDEIERNYNELGIKQIMFKDSTFTLNKEWVKELCDEIKRRKLKLNWTCNTRADHITEDVLNDLRSAGCYAVLFGIESASDEVLRNINKSIKIQQTVDAIRLCKKYGMKVIGSFMVGNPGDTKETVMKSIRFAKSLDLDLVSFGVTIAYPNTGLYKWAVENNVLVNKHWYMKDGSKETVGARELFGNVNLEGFPISEQVKMVKKANRMFYFSPKYIFKRIKGLNNVNEFKRLVKSVKEVIFS